MKHYFNWIAYLTICLFFFPISIQAQDITNGLVSRYTFSGNANDSFGTNNLSASENPQLTADRCGNANSAYVFDGTNHFFRNSPTGVTGSSYTYSAWMRLDEAVPRGATGRSEGSFTIMAIGNTGGDQFISVMNRYLGSDVNTGIVVTSYTNLGGIASVRTGVNPVVDTWFFITVTMNLINATQTEIRTYINGAPVGTPVTTGLPRYSDIQNSPVLTIGGRHGGTPIQFFRGAIDDVRIYNKALSACEVAILYRQNPQNQTTALADLQTSPITGPESVCPSTTQTYSITRLINPCTISSGTQPSSSTITWTAPAGASIVSGQGTPTVTINFGATYTTGTVTATESIGTITNCLKSSTLTVRSTAISCDKIQINFTGNSSTYVGSQHDAVVSITNTNATAATLIVTPLANPAFYVPNNTPKTVTVGPGQTVPVTYTGVFTQPGTTQLCFNITAANPCSVSSSCTWTNQCQTVRALTGCPASWSPADFVCGTDVLGASGSIKRSTLSVHNAFYNVTGLVHKKILD